MNLRTEVEINLHIAHTAMLRMCTLQSTSHSTTPPSPQHPAIYTDCLVECIVSGQPEPSVKALNSTYLLIGSIVSIFYVFYFLVSGVFLCMYMLCAAFGRNNNNNNNNYTALHCWRSSFQSDCGSEFASPGNRRSTEAGSSAHDQ